MFLNKRIIVLEAKGIMKDESIEEMESKLGKKFGCKVIILPPTIGSNVQVIK